MITLTLIAILLIVFLTVGAVLLLTGGALKMVFKLIFCLPIALICVVLGVAMCCTLILIPLGLGCFKLAGCILNPLRAGVA